MKQFSNKQFLAAIVTLTLSGAAMAQDGSDQKISDLQVVGDATKGQKAQKTDGRPAQEGDQSDQQLSQDQRAAREIQGFPGQDGPIPAKPAEVGDERNWDAKVAAQARDATDRDVGDGSDKGLSQDERAAREIQGYPGEDGPIPSKPEIGDERSSDRDLVRLSADATDRGIQFHLSGYKSSSDKKIGVIVLSLSPDVRQYLEDLPPLLWDATVLGFGDAAPGLSMALPSDQNLPDTFYAQGVVIAAHGGVQASAVTTVSSR